MLNGAKASGVSPSRHARQSIEWAANKVRAILQEAVEKSQIGPAKLDSPPECMGGNQKAAGLIRAHGFNQLRPTNTMLFVLVWHFNAGANHEAGQPQYMFGNIVAKQLIFTSL